MSPRLPNLLAATILMTAMAASAQDASSIPMRDFFRNPAKRVLPGVARRQDVSYTQPWQSGG